MSVAGVGGGCRVQGGWGWGGGCGAGAWCVGGCGGVGLGQKEIGIAVDPDRARIRPPSQGPGLWGALEGCMGVIAIL